MFKRKPALANKHDPAGPVRTIVSKSVADFRNIPVKHYLSVTISQNRIRPLLQLIALCSVVLRVIMKDILVKDKS